ncbi:hypothetical protein DENSPDRAFT_692466 [Dentipellis sp. KUC8613]|nr:hypothetical protein DENSPDRAFT_692466 [Dentipellis sp. KUC8613]
MSTHDLQPRAMAPMRSALCATCPSHRVSLARNDLVLAAKNGTHRVGFAISLRYSRPVLRTSWRCSHQ